MGFTLTFDQLENGLWRRWNLCGGRQYVVILIITMFEWTGLKKTTLASGHRYDAAAAKQINNVSASSWLLSSKCMFQLLLLWPVADVWWSTFGSLHFSSVLLQQGIQLDWLSFFHEIRSVHWYVLIFVSSAIRYWMGSLPCRRFFRCFFASMNQLCMCQRPE